MGTFSIVVVGGLAGTVGLLLLAPISVRAYGAAGSDELWGAVEMRWGPSLIMARLRSGARGRIYVLGIPCGRLPTWSRAKKEADEEKTRPFWTPNPWHVIGDERRLMIRMVGRALRALHPKLHVAGTVGLGDPADTAPMLAAARLIARFGSPRLELDVRDELMEDETHLFGRAGVWLVPAEILWILLVWFIRSDTRRVLRGR